MSSNYAQLPPRRIGLVVWWFRVGFPFVPLQGPLWVQGSTPQTTNPYPRLRAPAVASEGVWLPRPDFAAAESGLLQEGS